MLQALRSRPTISAFACALVGASLTAVLSSVRFGFWYVPIFIALFVVFARIFGPGPQGDAPAPGKSAGFRRDYSEADYKTDEMVDAYEETRSGGLYQDGADFERLVRQRDEEGRIP